MRVLTLEEALNLPTPRLLAYYKKYMNGKMPNGIVLEKEWEQLRKDIKTTLNTREHVEKEKPCKKK